METEGRWKSCTRSTKLYQEFECFPFDPAAPTLQTLQSAIAASDKQILDLKSASADGEAILIKIWKNTSLLKSNHFSTLYQTINVLPLQMKKINFYFR